MPTATASSRSRRNPATPRGGAKAGRGGFLRGLDNLANRMRLAGREAAFRRQHALELMLEDEDAAGQPKQHERRAQGNAEPEVDLPQQASPGNGFPAPGQIV